MIFRSGGARLCPASREARDHLSVRPSVRVAAVSRRYAPSSSASSFPQHPPPLPPTVDSGQPTQAPRGPDDSSPPTVVLWSLQALSRWVHKGWVRTRVSRCCFALLAISQVISSLCTDFVLPFDRKRPGCAGREQFGRLASVVWRVVRHHISSTVGPLTGFALSLSSRKKKMKEGGGGRGIEERGSGSRRRRRRRRRRTKRRRKRRRKMSRRRRGRRRKGGGGEEEEKDGEKEE